MDAFTPGETFFQSVNKAAVSWASVCPLTLLGISIPPMQYLTMIGGFEALSGLGLCASVLFGKEASARFFARNLFLIMLGAIYTHILLNELSMDKMGGCLFFATLSFLRTFVFVNDYSGKVPHSKAL